MHNTSCHTYIDIKFTEVAIKSTHNLLFKTTIYMFKCFIPWFLKCKYTPKNKLQTGVIYNFEKVDSDQSNKKPTQNLQSKPTLYNYL